MWQRYYEEEKQKMELVLNKFKTKSRSFNEDMASVLFDEEDQPRVQIPGTFMKSQGISKNTTDINKPDAVRVAYPIEQTAVMKNPVSTENSSLSQSYNMDDQKGTMFDALLKLRGKGKESMSER